MKHFLCCTQFLLQQPQATSLLLQFVLQTPPANLYIPPRHSNLLLFVSSFSQAQSTTEHIVRFRTAHNITHNGKLSIVPTSGVIKYATRSVGQTGLRRF